MTLSLGGSRFLSPGTPPRASVDPGGPDRPAARSALLATARRLPGVSSASSTDQVIDPRLIVQRVRRMAQLDATVFAEVRDDASQTLAATLVVLAALLLAALGGWLWLIVEVDGLSTGRILLREVLLGLISGLALWGLWVLSARLVLQFVFGRKVSGPQLVRTMGYAAFPLAGAALMVVPALGFAVGMLTVLAWFAASNAAIETAVPGATRREVFVANAAGFSLFVVLMSVLADAAGVAPGFFVHAADLSVYV